MMKPYGLSLLATLFVLPVSATAATPPPEAKPQNTTQSTSSNSSIAEKNSMEAKQYLEQNKQKPGVITLPSGLQYKIIEAGDDQKKSPGPTDLVTVHYKGTLIDGTEFDSSYSRGTPATFPVNAVIPGWTEALQLMKPGAKWLLTLPSNLAYGAQGAGPKIGPNAALVFEVELISIKPTAGSSAHNALEDTDEDG